MMCYKGNLQFAGRSGRLSFLAEVGIRQGCPLSPLIFAVVADVLLVAYVVLLNRSAQMAARPRRATYGYSGYGQQIDLRTHRPQRPQPVAVPGTRRVAN